MGGKLKDLDIQGGTHGWRVSSAIGAREFDNWETAYGAFRYVQTVDRGATITPVGASCR